MLTPIRLNISQRLREDREFRKGFLHSQVEDDIALSIRSLRKLRNKRQLDLANESGMKQSAISRIEQADYGNWNLKTLFRVSDALDARLRIVFDPIETVIEQYRTKESEINQDEFLLKVSETGVTDDHVARGDLLETADNRKMNVGLADANI